MAVTPSADARAALARYLSAPPAHPDLRAAAAAIARRDHGGAWRTLQRFIAAHPQDLYAYRMLGQIALVTGRADIAETVFARLAGLAPDFAPVRFELAGARFQLGKAAAALDDLRALLAREPGNPSYRALQAGALAKTGDFAAAAAIQAALCRDHPRHAAGWVAYGQTLRALRRTDDAVAAFRSAVAAVPHHGAAWWNLANLKTGALTAADGAAIAGALAASAASADDRFQLRFALARWREESSDFGSAWDAYVAANAERRALLPPRTGPDAAARAGAAIAALDAGMGGGDPSDAPIFVLGMPRSGSTLIEQILASHPDIEGLGELPDLGIVAAAAAAGGALTPERAAALGADYLTRVAAVRRTSRRHFVDKAPANWQHLGLIAAILPNARVIDMRRDAVACCLSMFRQHFAGGAAYSYAIDTLAAEYRAYASVLAHADAVRPGWVRRVALKSLTADTDDVVRDLLAWLDLPFDPACLRFYDTDRPVFTPSSEQVRRPINGDAAAIVAGFAPYLGDLRAALAVGAVNS